MAKIKLFDIDNVITTFKAIGVSLVVALVLIIPMFIGNFLVQSNIIVLGRIIQILTALSPSLLWGYFARKFWGWK